MLLQLLEIVAENIVVPHEFFQSVFCCGKVAQLCLYAFAIGLFRSQSVILSNILSFKVALLLMHLSFGECLLFHFPAQAHARFLLHFGTFQRVFVECLHQVFCLHAESFRHISETLHYAAVIQHIVGELLLYGRTSCAQSVNKGLHFCIVLGAFYPEHIESILKVIVVFVYADKCAHGVPQPLILPPYAHVIEYSVTFVKSVIFSF